jgi:uncharacterized membrane protein
MRSGLALVLVVLAAGCSAKGPQPKVTESARPGSVPNDRLLEGVEAEAAITQPTIIALGTEPFWSVVAENGTLAWTSPEEPVGRPVTASAVSLHRGWLFRATLDGKPLELVVADVRCSDGMSETVYPMTAKLLKGAETFHGCARDSAPGKR